MYAIVVNVHLFDGQVAPRTCLQIRGFLLAKNYSPMLGKVKTIVQFAPQKRLINLDVDGVMGKTYIVESNRNSKRWEKVKIGDSLSGLDWFDKEAKIIDADSEIIILK